MATSPEPSRPECPSPRSPGAQCRPFDGYGADVANLDIMTEWVESEPCPPRNGPSQNLAGAITSHPLGADTVVYGCSYQSSPEEALPPVADNLADLGALYRARVAGEIQRLRVNIDRQIFFVLETGGGYVQCAPQAPDDAIYCEAQSPDSWPVLARIITPERLKRLHAAGYVDPGYSPNYSRSYALNEFGDTAIADELLAVLFDVYGYNGVPALEFVSESLLD